MLFRVAALWKDKCRTGTDGFCGMEDWVTASAAQMRLMQAATFLCTHPKF